MHSILEALWARGVPVSQAEIHKWYRGRAVDPEGTAEAVERIYRESGEKEWAAVVAVDLINFVGEEGVKDIARAPHPLALIVEWRKREWDPGKTHKPVHPPSYVEHVKDPVDFFLNVLRYEFGVDVDGIVDGVKEVVGEKHVGDFMRLVDVDAPYPPEEFVERVDRAVEILTRAREQGVDVEEVVKEWDALADAGGERLEKLPDAVKAVAEREVRKRFWKDLVKELAKRGVNVFSRERPEVMEKMYLLELIDVDGEVSFENAEEYIDGVAEIVKKTRPIPVIKSDELVDVLEKTGLERANTKDVLLDTTHAISSMNRKRLGTYLSSDLWHVVLDYIMERIKKGEDRANIVARVSEALDEIAAGNIVFEEDLERFFNR